MFSIFKCLKQRRFYRVTKDKYFHDNTFTYLFWQSLVCHVNGYPRRHNVNAWFVNMVFSDEHKIPIKIYSWRDITWYSWGQNFRTKDGRQVALTDCWRRSETWAQWTDVRAATDREVSARTKHWPGERYGSESRVPAPNSQHSPWNITEDRHS